MTTLRIAPFVFAIALSVLAGSAGGALASPVAPGGLTSGETKLPPGWCYSDAVGTYECKFKVRFPWPGW